LAKTPYSLPKLTRGKADEKLQHSNNTDDDELKEKPQKPAAKLESYAGQGASLESFPEKFESHSEYFKWTNQDRVFQLKKTLSGTAAQALRTGGKKTVLRS